MSSLESGHAQQGNGLSGTPTESRWSQPEELARSVARLTEDAERLLVESAQTIHSLTAAMEQIQPQMTAAAKAAKEVRELADTAQERAKSARTWSIIATIASTICTGLGVTLLVLLIHIQK